MSDTNERELLSILASYISRYADKYVRGAIMERLSKIDGTLNIRDLKNDLYLPQALGQPDPDK